MSTITDITNSTPVSTEKNKKRKHKSDSKESRKKVKQENSIDSARPTPLGEVVDRTAEKTKTKKRAKDQSEHDLFPPSEVKPQPATSQEDIEIHDASEEEPVNEQSEVQQHARTYEEISPNELSSPLPTSFYSTRMSLYLPIPSIGLPTSVSSVCALHLSPLLLTYYPPAKGVVLGYVDPVLSARPEPGLNKPLIAPSNGNARAPGPDETLSKVGEEQGICWSWLTVTFLLFRPTPGDQLTGWTNVQSEGFIGLVSYNYFQTSIGKDRIPKSWKWTGAAVDSRSRQKKQTRKGRLNDSEGASQDTAIDSQGTVVQPPDDEDHDENSLGTFVNANGQKVPETTTFKVTDLETVPGHERGKWTIQVEGTLLSDEDEAAVQEEERLKWESRQNRSRARNKTLMSGGLASSRAVSVASG